MLSVLKSVFPDIQIETLCYLGFRLLGLLSSAHILNLSNQVNHLVYIWHSGGVFGVI